MSSGTVGSVSARAVKRADIEDNMDRTRLDEVDDGVLTTQRMYHEAWQRLRAAEE